MAATGVAFVGVTAFWPLLVMAVLGTMNPSAGDVSVFLPSELALLADEVAAPERPRIYARYNVAGAVAAAFGALASGLPDRTRPAFVVYVVAAVVVMVLYVGLTERIVPEGARPGPLRQSRRTVFELAALFCLDTAAGGFAVTSMVVLWLHLRWDLEPAATGAVFFVAGLLSAGAQLLSGRIAARIGLVETMAFTHLPASVLLVLLPFAPTLWVALVFLLVRSALAQMDVPIRQAYVMAVVPPEERAAAASVTNVPRSLASASTPFLAGWMLANSDFGWPLIVAGVGKVAYDLLLLRLFRTMPVEEGAVRSSSGSRRSGSRRT